MTHDYPGKEGAIPRYAERIFVVIQRLHGKNAYSRTGIGLAICKKIVERHGDKNWVESEVGKKAASYLSIPDDWESISERES
ncbi:MAG TPA: ATP-binding protein [Candidatus Binatia bacterium]|nr:ATP-binding protein [Candidatus Binatia bacterium]